MIGIVGYGLGNVRAIANVYESIGVVAEVVSTPSAVERACRLILPGVGAFDQAMSRLADSGLVPSLEHSVLRRGIPLLGICVGMQMLARRSEEGEVGGLGWVAGEVRHLDTTLIGRKPLVPHLGWNSIEVRHPSKLLEGLDSIDTRFYFLHSYYFDADDPADIIAVTRYGREIPTIVGSGNIVGVQFHPEKSHDWGVRLLHNFALGS